MATVKQYTNKALGKKRFYVVLTDEDISAINALKLPKAIVHAKEMPINNNKVTVVGHKNKDRVVPRSFIPRENAERIKNDINFVREDIKKRQKRSMNGQLQTR